MFWISKKKVFWKDLWKEGFVDIHNHLLWGIDDGSKSLEETVTLCNAMQELGITAAFATPHTYPGQWNNTAADINLAYSNYCNQTNDVFIKGVASEYLAESYLEEWREQNNILTLPGNHILIEFSMLFAPSERIMETLFQLKLKGYKLIIAHPERYLYWKNNRKAFERLKIFDLYFQMNSLSLIGYYGPDVQKLCKQLIELEMYDFIGTDTHRMEQLAYTQKTPIQLNQKSIEIVETLVTANKTFETIPI
jgi:tyrosine-protein phosphatase YwqE